MITTTDIISAIGKLNLIKEWHEGIGFYPNDRGLEDEHKQMAMDLGNIITTLVLCEKEMLEWPPEGN